MHTTGSTADDDASDAFVNAPEPPSIRETLGRLQPGFDRVDWKEEQVYGGTGQPACLTVNACTALVTNRRK